MCASAFTDCGLLRVRSSGVSQASFRPVVCLHYIPDIAVASYSSSDAVSFKLIHFLSIKHLSLPVAFRLVCRMLLLLPALYIPDVAAARCFSNQFTPIQTLSLLVVDCYLLVVWAGCVGCSAWVPMNKLYPAALGSAAKNIPVAQFHGTRDEIVRFTWGQDRSVHSTQ